MNYKFVFPWLTLLILLFCAPSVDAAPQIGASSVVLLDASSGEIIYSKNAETPRPPASTTKIMTCLMAIECADLEQVVVVSETAASTGEASLHLKSGDRIMMKNLLHGALLKSGNDACVAIAEATAFSEEEFVGLMNLKAIALGAYHTTFVNSNGLPQNGHLTTAYDLAVITRYALRNKLFSEIVNKKEYLLKWEDSSRKMYLQNTNKLLWEYPYATGVKTGTTDKAGKCLVASAKCQGKEVIAVLLNSPNRFGEARRLLEYGFSSDRS